MSHTIYKYPFRIDDAVTLLLPVNAKVLRVAAQNGIPTMWMLHNTNTEVVTARTFRVYGTGHEILDIESLIYVGTFELNRFVWHVFEEIGAGTTFIEDLLKQSLEQNHA